MKLRWAGDDKIMRGVTALDCLRYHCHGDHSVEAQCGDLDGVMQRLAAVKVREDRSQCVHYDMNATFDLTYATLPTLDERCAAFVKTAIDCGLIVDMSS